MDKRQNPEIYPDWLSFEINPTYGGIDYNPYINWEKWTSSDHLTLVRKFGMLDLEFKDFGICISNQK